MWRLNSISSGLNGWTGTLTIVDTCGYETSGTIVVEDCDVVNDFAKRRQQNDKFQIRGLNGMMDLVLWCSTATDLSFGKVKRKATRSTNVERAPRQWQLCGFRHLPMGPDQSRWNGTVERGQLTVFSGEY